MIRKVGLVMSLAIEVQIPELDRNARPLFAVALCECVAETGFKREMISLLPPLRRFAAELFDIPVDTVMSRLHRARRAPEARIAEAEGVGQ